MQNIKGLSLSLVHVVQKLWPTLKLKSVALMQACTHTLSDIFVVVFVL